MQNIKAIIPAKDKWVSLVWQVNDWCNFRCTYCSEWNWAGRNKNEDDINLIVSTLERIMLHYKDKGYKYFKFNIVLLNKISFSLEYSTFSTMECRNFHVDLPSSSL